MTQAVLVLGATGTVGRRVAARLRERGRPVVAASRSGEMPFDWSDERTWVRAVDGADRAFVMAPDGVAVDPRFVARAVAGGVRRLVLLSSRSIDLMNDERLLAAERAVRESGTAWTVVRADWFDQNFDEGFLRDAVLAGEVVVPVGEVRQGFVDAGDVAGVAVEALTGDGHQGQVYEVTGPAALTFAEATAIVSRAAGVPVTFLGAAGDYVRVMTEAGLDAQQVAAEVAAFEALRRQGDALVTDTVERVTGHPPRSLERYAAEAAARGAWARAQEDVP